METIITTTNPVTLNFAEAVLKEADIPCFIMDEYTSVIEGSVGAIPRRMMVDRGDLDEAIEALEAAGLKDELFRGK